MKKWLILFYFIIFSLLLLTCTSLIRYGVQDIPPVEVDDLYPARSVIVDEENAYTYLSKNINDIYWPTNATDLLKKENHETLLAEKKALLSSNEAVFKVLNHAIQFERYLSPALTNHFSIAPLVAEHLKIARLLSLQTRIALEEGDYNKALDSNLLGINVASLIQQEPSSLIEYLVSQAMLNMHLLQGNEMVCDSKAPSFVLTQLQQALEQTSSPREGFIHSMKGEFFWVSNTIDSLSLDGLRINDVLVLLNEETIATRLNFKITKMHYMPNRTEHMFATLYRTFIKDANLWYLEINPDNLEEEIRELDLDWSATLKPNVVGHVLLNTFRPNPTIIKHLVKMDVSVSGLRLLCALHLYHREQGHFPKTLKALVPKYISEVPLDPIDGTPFRYDPHQGVVYSIGFNGRDDEGSSYFNAGTNTNDFRDAEDIVFSLLPRPE